jgi:hypothetical protein
MNCPAIDLGDRPAASRRLPGQPGKAQVDQQEGERKEREHDGLERCLKIEAQVVQLADCRM